MMPGSSGTRSREMRKCRMLVCCLTCGVLTEGRVAASCLVGCQAGSMQRAAVVVPWDW